MIIEYSSKNIKGHLGKKVWIHLDFLPSIQIIDDVCKEFGFVFWVTNSYRKETDVLKGAIVDPAKASNHKIGHGVDGNLQHIKTGEWFNSKKMGDGSGDDENVIKEIQKRGVRWGGTFRKKDEVHFDDAYNIEYPEKWKQKYNQLQND